MGKHIGKHITQNAKQSIIIRLSQQEKLATHSGEKPHCVPTIHDMPETPIGTCMVPKEIYIWKKVNK